MANDNDIYTLVKAYFEDKETRCSDFIELIDNSKKIYNDAQIKELKQIVTRIQNQVKKVDIDSVESMKDASKIFKDMVKKETERQNQKYNDIKMILLFINQFYCACD